jgi:hypothetical protein
MPLDGYGRNRENTMNIKNLITMAAAPLGETGAMMALIAQLSSCFSFAG